VWSFGEILGCDGIDFAASGADDLICGAKDFWSRFSGIASALKPRPWLIQF